MGISSVEVGCRVFCEGQYGTVLYTGPIEGIDGVWLGVEWDNKLRGKHSGCYNNITYFETKIPNAGSFIRVSKAELGISCPNALKLKYGHEDTSSVIPNFINLPQKSGPERHVEMIGMKKIMGKQSNLSRLTDVVLSGMKVNGPGEQNELKAMAPNLRNLDLSHNLLPSWTAVNEIVSQLTHLTTLILSKNRLRIPDFPDYQEYYKHLKLLILNDMSYTWNEILTCAVMWPEIEELSIQDNMITVLETPHFPIFSKIRYISLDNNCIENWTEICKLGTLKSLKELHIDNTSLESIAFPNVSPLEKTELFTNLEVLFLRHNKLNQWQDVSELNKLSNLKTLMINNNPISSLESPETTRQFIIAKIQGLETLNRTQVERSERRGAELDYIKKFFNDWILDDSYKNGIQKTKSSPFLILHPTYPVLIQKHGAPDENEVKVKSTLIKDNLMYIQLYSPLYPDIPPCIRKIPAEMTVAKLKALVKRIFKLPTPDVTLTLVYNEHESQRTVLDNNLRQLSFYSISNKDRISVEW